MTRFSASPIRLGTAALFLVLVLLLTTGCGTLRPTLAANPTYYSLDTPRSQPGAVLRTAAQSTTDPTLIINPSHAASGFDSQRIIYVRSPHRLEYFAHSEWIDTPARMLVPLIITAVERTGAFVAVVPTPSAATGELRLDTEIVRLQHEFDRQPSRVRFTLRTYIVDNTSRRVIAWREFDESVEAASDTPAGGIVAANQAVQAVLERLASFCNETAARWQTSAAETPKRSEPTPH